MPSVADPGQVSSVRVGFDLQRAVLGLDPDDRVQVPAHVERSGLDHVGVGDHVSFHDGTGFDGLIASAVALSGTSRVGVQVGIYQLALRHPLPVARQLADLERSAPGRRMFGVGAGGEDRRRYGQVAKQVRAAAADRSRHPDRFALSVWCAFGREDERAELFRGLKDLYRADEDALRPYCPVGSPAQVADFLLPYRDAGCTSFTIMPGHRRTVDVVDQAEPAALLAA